MDIFPKATWSERTRLGVPAGARCSPETGVLLRRDRQGDPVVIMQEPRSNAMRVDELACQLVDHTRLSPRIDLAPAQPLGLPPLDFLQGRAGRKNPGKTPQRLI